jgi:hypothetical protein
MSLTEDKELMPAGLAWAVLFSVTMGIIERGLRLAVMIGALHWLLNH